MLQHRDMQIWFRGGDLDLYYWVHTLWAERVLHVPKHWHVIFSIFQVRQLPNLFHCVDECQWTSPHWTVCVYVAAPLLPFCLTTRGTSEGEHFPLPSEKVQVPLSLQSLDTFQLENCNTLYTKDIYGSLELQIQYRLSGNFGAMEILALLVDDKNTPN